MRPRNSERCLGKATPDAPREFAKRSDSRNSSRAHRLQPARGMLVRTLPPQTIALVLSAAFLVGAGSAEVAVRTHHAIERVRQEREIGGGPIGATSTLVAEYFRASGLKLSADVATALFYGIKADTRDLGRQTTKQDVDAYLWLFPLVDKDALSEIEHPKLPQEYFVLYHTAIERAQVYDDAVVCDLGEIYAPDMVAEVAERFMYLEGMRWSLGFAEYEDALFFSVRTNDRRMNAGRLIRDVIEVRGGSAGGHGTMAGARLPMKGLSAAARKRLHEDVVRAFLDAFGIKARRARALV